MTLAERATAGEHDGALEQAIVDAVAEWHRAGADGVPLHQHLGLSWLEFSAWVEKRMTLERIVVGRRVAIEALRPDHASHPHCDELVLHAPGACEFCDHYPQRQRLRVLERVAFTGHVPQVGFSSCPSEERRGLASIERWPGNRPYRAC